MIQITCTACSARLSIPEEKLPKNLTHFVGKCPKCQQKIEVNLDRPAGLSTPTSPAQPVASPAAPPPNIPPPAPRPPAEAPVPLDEEFTEGRRLAMACFDDAAAQAAAKTALEELGYMVHAPATASEAVQRLRRSKYEVVLLHDQYGGSADGNPVLKLLQPMPMSSRRTICVGLVSKDLLTMDHMAAFAHSVNFTVAEKELDKIKSIVQHGVLDHDNFYRPFMEALKDAGKA